MGICLKKNLVPRVPSLLERFFKGLYPANDDGTSGTYFPFFCKYLPTTVNLLSSPPPPPSQIRLFSKKPPFQGKEISNTAILLSSSPLPSSFVICSSVKSSDVYSVILGCITSNFLYLSFPLCILVLPVD